MIRISDSSFFIHYSLSANYITKQFACQEKQPRNSDPERQAASITAASLSRLENGLACAKIGVMLFKKYPVLLFAVLGGTLFAVSLWALLGGPTRIGLSEAAGAIRAALNGDLSGEGAQENVTAIVLLEIRLPRMLLALAVGASLAVSGAAFQGFFRNALADPYVIGSSSGAALGAAAAMVGGFTLSGSPFSGVTAAAFAGAFLAVFLAFALARTAGNPPPAAALLLAGMSIGAFFSALLSMILVLKDRDLYRVYYWLLGSLTGTSWTQLASVLPVMAAGILLIFFQDRRLDILLQGDETAESLGVDTGKTRLVVALGSSLTCAAAVSVCGVIGFVGLIAPHAMRILAGPAHRKLLPASALAGAILLVTADALSRSLLPPMEIPIGIICSLAGCPFFLYLLAKHGRNRGRM
jgi:iron complex transport system permease protein